ncbi:pantoate--beta-alanine ligase [Campylobacter corcagiensis]|uniref:Pantothenate synthetase n=1 Tax=Campylobacter corcagiensis TaxID=1448857 RepID=A0A7M1LH57_9BACT|nr:pantoate--beta-alanine ligase [Campylobacter corcagiensis]QKF64144.1 pantothenate synthetase [Campylobacter corcagiensis]QOQ87661.1 pantoate--beta-alanine ligase [Campylobacter corcagiensis]
MEIFHSPKELKDFLKDKNKTIGFVPTMGALHDGHISLFKKARSENEIVVASVFLNPTQFGENEDLDKYPRNDERDIRIARICEVDALFMPKPEEIYDKNEPLIKAPEKLATILEGKTRPGHFDGVLRVLNKLFNIVKPTKAYFGKKDTQQLAIVENMVRTFFMDIEIVPCDIIRESDGLAISSRNAYLSEEDKLYALKISQSLAKAGAMIKKGELSTNSIKTQMLSILEPLEIDYVAITNRRFEPLDKIELDNTFILVAANVGQTRLIDNLWV